MNNQFTGTTHNFPLIQSNGGLNTTASPLSVEDKEASDIKNVELDQWGSLIKRNGYLNLVTAEVNSGAAGTGLFQYESSTNDPFLISVFGDKYYKMDALDGTFDDITDTATITDAQNNQWQFKTYNDIVFGTNNTDLLLKWTGTGNVASMTVPTDLTTAKTIEVFTEYFFVANVTVDGTAYKSRIYWSSPGAPETWNDADWVNINKNDGTEIVCLKTLGDKLIIFKNRSIHIGVYTGDSDIPFVFAKTPSHVGCIARDSVQEIGNGLIFLSYDGFYYFDGTNSLKISEKINYTISNDLDLSRLQYAVSATYKKKNQYICFVTQTGETGNNYGLIYDYYSKAWLTYEGASVNAITTYYDDGDEKIYFSDYDGFTYQMDTGTSDYPLAVKTAIDAYYKTKWFHFGDITHKKAIPHLYLYAAHKNATLTIGYSFDFEEVNQQSLTVNLASSAATYGSALYGTGTYAGIGGFSQRLDLQGRGRVFRLSFENNALDEEFKIHGYSLMVYQETAS